LRDTDDFDSFLIGVDSDPSAHGRLLCDVFKVIPVAELNEKKYIDELLDVNSNFGIDVLIALSEGESRVIARHREIITNAGIRTSVSSLSTVEVMTDKFFMLKRLDKFSLNAGLFVSVDTYEDAQKALKILGYPEKKVVFKPRKGSGSRGVLIADSSKKDFQHLLSSRFCGTGDFEKICQNMKYNNMLFHDMVAVHYYEGPVFDVECIALKGQVIDMAARRRQLRNPLSPISTGHKIDMNSVVLNFASELCSVFGLDGAGDFDIVLSENGIPRLFDSGARFSGSVGGSFSAGANFMAQLVRVLMGMKYDSLVVKNNSVLRPYVTMVEIPENNEKDLL
jgi:carbamoyl-phosphate synthase large subunit